MNRIRSHTNRRFEQIIVDAGYENSENYLYLEENGQKCFIRPQNYGISKKRSYKANPYTVENMGYNEKKDEYVCSDGRKLKYKRESKKTTENGYVITTRYFSNDKCGRCPHREKCHRSKNEHRTVRVNRVLNERRTKTLEALMSEEGTLLRMNRSIQVEGVFCALKEDYGFRRFLTRGKRNIETQFFLFAFALNIEKLCNREKKGRFMRFAQLQPSVLESESLRAAYDYRLFYAVSGNAVLKTDREMINLSPGMILFLCPGSPYSFLGRMKTIVLNFDLSRRNAHRKNRYPHLLCHHSDKN